MATESNFIGASACKSGAVTAPAGGAAVVTLDAAAGLVPGAWYQVIVKIGFGSTGDVPNNFYMSVWNGATQSPIYNPLAHSGLALYVTQHVFERVYVPLNAASNITVYNIAPGAVGSVYLATIIATRVQ